LLSTDGASKSAEFARTSTFRRTRRLEKGTTVHELSLCDSIARLAVDHAGGRPVLSVQLRVGALRQIVPDTLEFCWTAVSRHPLLDSALLDIERVPGVIACGDCGVHYTLVEFLFRCPACDSCLGSVVSGEEFLVTAIEVAEDNAPLPSAVPTSTTSKE
jgi:hydrogenase nickel incorporation protein HypA/HybF